MWREICTCCGRVTRMGFTVPDEIWQKAIPSFYQNSVLCIVCFGELADEALVPWDENIKFWPVSLKRHLDLNQEESK